MSQMVFLNGVFLPADAARIRIDDAGFLWGYALFETMRAYGGRIFRPQEHLMRLATGAAELAIAFDGADWESKMTKLVALNGLTEARVRVALSAGVTDGLGKGGSPTRLITAVSYAPPAPEIYREGWSIVFSPYTRNSLSPLARLKSANYLESLLARREAGAAGFAEAILCNEKGFVAEAAAGNIFIVRKGVLETPDIGSGVLPGITRRIVLELASCLGIPAHEGEITPEEVTAADEVFLTNSLIEIMPVRMVGKCPVGSGRAGGITALLQEAYSSLVRKECVPVGAEGVAL